MSVFEESSSVMASKIGLLIMGILKVPEKRVRVEDHTPWDGRLDKAIQRKQFLQYYIIDIQPFVRVYLFTSLINFKVGVVVVFTPNSLYKNVRQILFSFKLS